MNKKILIAENNSDFSYVIQWHFEQKGFIVLESKSGQEAIRLFESERPDIVLLDINLDDGVDGKQVARKIREQDKYTPVIFMSGESKSPADVVEGFEIGCNFFLKKPVAIEEIEAHINTALKSLPNEKIYKFEKCSIISSERIIRFGNYQKEYLSDKENRVLTLLCDYISVTVNSSDILKNVWHDEYMEESLRNIISSLRKKISNKGLQIETVKNKGYRLEVIY
jgi:DNA-binding response OmpR family regulator